MCALLRERRCGRRQFMAKKRRQIVAKVKTHEEGRLQEEICNLPSFPRPPTGKTHLPESAFGLGSAGSGAMPELYALVTASAIVD